MDHGKSGGVVAKPAGGQADEHHRRPKCERLPPVPVTLDAAWAATENARRMCTKAAHDHPVPFAPCIPHVIEAARAAFAP